MHSTENFEVNGFSQVTNICCSAGSEKKSCIMEVRRRLSAVLDSRVGDLSACARSVCWSRFSQWYMGPYIGSERRNREVYLGNNRNSWFFIVLWYIFPPTELEAKPRVVTMQQTNYYTMAILFRRINYNFYKRRSRLIFS